MGRRIVLRLVAACAVALGAIALPASASAHPLGNFTINHYAGLTIARDHVDLDVVIDMAEIPTFQERQTMDTDGDGSVADEEAAAWATDRCATLAGEFSLERAGHRLSTLPTTAAAAFPAGAGGLSTLRLECAYGAALEPAIAASTELSFADGSYAERIGWREIVVQPSGTILDPGTALRTSPSRRLTAYPADMISAPLDIRSATIAARPDPAAGTSTGPVASAAPQPVAPNSAAVPGGVAGELPDIFRARDLTPFVLIASIVTALGIGALHALTPGHGKTLMAAYLVGTRGTAVHAVGLGLSVAISHTLGIVVLAAIILGAGALLPPDVVYRVTPVLAGVSIVAIGGWMLVGEVRRRGARAATEHAHSHEDAHSDAQEHEQEHRHDPDALVHSHGGTRHSHVPAPDRGLTWRGLFVLGLAGGLIPSTSALILLLSSIAAGRAAFGFVLVVAFGIGMAVVMTSIGMIMVVARTRLDRMPSRSSLGRLAAAAPVVASVAVLGLGLILTWQAVSGAPVL